EPNTTDLFLNNSTAGYTGSPAVNESWCKPGYYTMTAIPGVFIAVSLCGLVGNMVVVWFLGFHMKKSPFTVYVLNLAVADFSQLLLLLFKFTLDIIEKVYCISSEQYLWATMYLVFLFLFFYSASMYLLTAMSMERCLSVL
ncbi:MAS protein, partial [Hemiprocne comata]|nr:MAS protein [Hemiprocne comata]